MDSAASSEARQRTQRWLHFLRHLTIFVSVNLLILVIDVLGGTDDFFVHWVAAIWGTILAIHFVDTFLLGGLLGFGGGHCFGGREARSLERTGGRSR